MPKRRLSAAARRRKSRTATRNESRSARNKRAREGVGEPEPKIGRRARVLNSVPQALIPYMGKVGEIDSFTTGLRPILLEVSDAQGAKTLLRVARRHISVLHDDQ